MNKIILLLFFVAFASAQNNSSPGNQSLEGVPIVQVNWTSVHLEGMWNISNTNCSDVCYPDIIGINTTTMTENYTYAVSIHYDNDPVICGNASGLTLKGELQLLNMSLADQEEKDLSNGLTSFFNIITLGTDSVYFPQNDSITYILVSPTGNCTANYQRVMNVTN